MKSRILAPARSDLREAVAHLNDQKDGLGQEFLAEVRSTISRIEQLPFAWAPLGNEIRRCRTRRFKYGVIYTVENEEIIVIAIAHIHRSPTYWRDRRE